MKLKDDNWVFCLTCKSVSYRFDCCGHLSCTGMGCPQCMDRTEVDRRLEAQEYPDPGTMEALPGLTEFINERFVWLAEEAWTDPLENRPGRAFGYQAVGFFRHDDEEATEAWVEEGGLLSREDCWAIPEEGAPRRQISSLPKLCSPIDPSELEDFLSGK